VQQSLIRRLSREAAWALARVFDVIVRDVPGMNGKSQRALPRRLRHAGLNRLDVAPDA
jgi:hypothetical protein